MIDSAAVQGWLHCSSIDIVEEWQKLQIQGVSSQGDSVDAQVVVCQRPNKV